MEDSSTIPAPAPPRTNPPAQACKSAPNDEGSITETVEAMLVAFILAFILRAFVVEAFVIPTGSMAPTLLGAHMRFHCDDCGYDWDVNFPASSDRDDISIPRNAGPIATQSGPVDWVFSVRCPNCGYKVQRYNAIDADNRATNPPVYYGDRILVLKFLYLFQDPRRWD